MKNKDLIYFYEIKFLSLFFYLSFKFYYFLKINSLCDRELCKSYDVNLST